MRQTKKPTAESKEHLDRIDRDFEVLRQHAMTNALLMVLNLDAHIHAGTETKFTPESRKRITDLTILLKRTADELNMMDPVSERAPLNETFERCSEARKEMNKLFEQVRLIPQIDLALNGRQLRVSEDLYIDPKINMENLAANSYKVNGTDLNMLEQMAILGLCSLLKNSSLDTLRRCECGDWFLATRSDQKFCSPACRQRAHAAKPTAKSARRKNYNSKKVLTEAKRRKNVKTAK